MSCLHVQYLFSFLVLFSLFQTVRANSKNSLEEIVVSKINKTARIAGLNEKLDDDIVKKLNMRNFNVNATMVTPLRMARTVANGTLKYNMQCLTCFANSSSGSWSCYSGIKAPVKKCADAEQCYTEINPAYIKRGCILPGRVNRTFVCKCPLCNDKPSYDLANYEYKKICDWEYDNARLQAPLVGMDLMCKVCETKGTNPTSDKNCRSGKNADYMVCAHNQLCYTNIDDETDFVSRGCIDKPLLNSMYMFCNGPKCNTQAYPNPHLRIRLRSHSIRLWTDDSKIKRVGMMSSGSTKTFKLCPIFIIISALKQYFN